MVFDTSAIALVTMSIVTAKGPAGSCLCSSIEASKVVRVSPLSKALMMAILSSAWVMFFCFQTSALFFWVSIHSWGFPSLKRLMCFLYVPPELEPACNFSSMVTNLLLFSLVLVASSGTKGKTGFKKDTFLGILLVIIFVLTCSMILILVQRSLKDRFNFILILFIYL